MRRLLLVDQLDRAVLGDLDGGSRALLDDGVSGGERVRVRTAVWSSAGQWAACAVDTGDPDDVQEVRLFPPGGEEPRVIASALLAFYLCPSPCGRYLSHLSPGPLGLELAVSDVDSGELRVIERGQPLFWSWSPDSSRIAVHVGDRALVASKDGETETVLTERAGSFVAPWWMPDGSVVVITDDSLTSHGPDGSVNRLAERPPAGRFALDPDGRRLALVDLVDGLPALVVVDLLTGDRNVVVAERTAAFFWSPEGRRISALVLAGPGVLQWVVSDGERSARLPPFRPAPGWLREVLPFFEQYAHSHAVWSADETHLVAPGLDADGATEAVVQASDGSATWEAGARPPIGLDVRVPGARLVWWAD